MSLLLRITIQPHLISGMFLSSSHIFELSFPIESGQVITLRRQCLPGAGVQHDT